VAIKTHLALTLWALGFPDRARATIEEALSVARQVGHPFSEAFAQYFYAWFHKLCGEEATVLSSSSAAVSICEKYDFPFWGFSSGALRGSSVAERGEAESGIAQIREKLTAFEATGGLLHRSPLRGLLAAAYDRAGLADDAMREVSEAITAVEGRNERWWESELHRLRGELHLASGNVTEAEASLRNALDIARRQGARSWELRAALSLGRFEKQRGNETDGRELVAAVYASMTEGFGSSDMREAEAFMAH
jgi:predicted ATPase